MSNKDALLGNMGEKATTPTEYKEKEIQEMKNNSPLLESTPAKSWVDKQGKLSFVFDPKINGANPFKKIAGTKDSELAENIVLTGANAIHSIMELGDNSIEKTSICGNIILQSLHDFQPKDAIEARLVSQAAALHQHGMSRLARAGSSDQISHSEAQTNMATKLFRCHNDTIEALNRHRRGGEQKVVVQHVNIDNSGGGRAAIVGAIINDQK